MVPCNSLDTPWCSGNICRLASEPLFELLSQLTPPFGMGKRCLNAPEYIRKSTVDRYRFVRKHGERSEKTQRYHLRHHVTTESNHQQTTPLQRQRRAPGVGVGLEIRIINDDTAGQISEHSNQSIEEDMSTPSPR